MLTSGMRITLVRGFIRSVVLLAAVGCPTSLVLAQPAGTFTPTESMTTKRFSHTATLLSDGRVLIAGGNIMSGKFSPTPSAELYDPSTGTFTATGTMITTRLGYTATLLPDGKVLIAGGVDALSDPLATAELYDPHTGTFTAAGDMTVARSGHLATLLSNGKVLIAGGIDPEGYPNICPTLEACAFAELYDPHTGTFTAAGEMTVFPYPKTATLLPDGRVLIAAQSIADLYDPHTDTFVATGGMTTPRAGQSATLLPNGKVLIAGGITLGVAVINKPLVTAELFDPATGTFIAATGNMITGLALQTSTLLPDGTVLLAGGWLNGGPANEDLAGAELYDPLAGTFRATGGMATGRCSHTATLLNDGSVLIAGGYESYSSDCIPGLLDSAERHVSACLSEQSRCCG